MMLPTEYDDDFLGHEAGFGACYPDGTPIRTRVYSLVYPPPGFLPFYGIGNGDYHGFYWPIGREVGPPTVSFSSHDVGSLIPETPTSNRSIVANLQKVTATAKAQITTVNWLRKPVANHRRNMTFAA